MCLMLDQFLWGHSSRVCDISCLFFSDKRSAKRSRIWTKTETVRCHVWRSELSLKMRNASTRMNKLRRLSTKRTKIMMEIYHMRSLRWHVHKSTLSENTVLLLVFGHKLYNEQRYLMKFAHLRKPRVLSPLLSLRTARNEVDLVPLACEDVTSHVEDIPVSLSSHYRPASKTPLKWRFAGGLIVVRFHVLTGSLQRHDYDWQLTQDGYFWYRNTTMDPFSLSLSPQIFKFRN